MNVEGSLITALDRATPKPPTLNVQIVFQRPSGWTRDQVRSMVDAVIRRANGGTPYAIHDAAIFLDKHEILVTLIDAPLELIRGLIKQPEPAMARLAPDVFRRSYHERDPWEELSPL